MKYKKLGKSGLLVSEIALGSWLNFGIKLDFADSKKLISKAFDLGINFFDTAEVYASGLSEMILGEVLRDFKRDEFVLSTKLYWGGEKPNQEGLSRKHLREGLTHSLRRLQTDYVDLLFLHRYDPNTPLEEILYTVNQFIQEGKVFYWGTSQWGLPILEEAYEICRKRGYMLPIVEQSLYNLLSPARLEKELTPLIEKEKLALMTYSPLAGGLLTGKYQNKVTRQSRYGRFPKYAFPEWKAKRAIISELIKMTDKLNLSLSQASIGWCLKNPKVTSVILGVTSLAQLEENCKALDLPEKAFEALDHLNHLVNTKIYA